MRRMAMLVGFLVISGCSGSDSTTTTSTGTSGTTASSAGTTTSGSSSTTTSSGSSGGTTGGSCTDTWASYGSSFFSTSCTTCHSSATQQQAPYLETQSQVQANRALVQGQISSGAMPQNTTLDPGTKSRILAYLACGAP